MLPSAAASAPESHSKTGESPARSILKRAVLGIVVLIVIVSSGAWLLHSGIGAEAEPADDAVAVSAPADRTR